MACTVQQTFPTLADQRSGYDLRYAAEGETVGFLKSYAWLAISESNGDTHVSVKRSQVATVIAIRIGVVYRRILTHGVQWVGSHHTQSLRIVATLQ